MERRNFLKGLLALPFVTKHLDEIKFPTPIEEAIEVEKLDSKNYPGLFNQIRLFINNKDAGQVLSFSGGSQNQVIDVTNLNQRMMPGPIDKPSKIQFEIYYQKKIHERLMFHFTNAKYCDCQLIMPNQMKMEFKALISSITINLPTKESYSIEVTAKIKGAITMFIAKDQR